MSQVNAPTKNNIQKNKQKKKTKTHTHTKEKQPILQKLIGNTNGNHLMSQYIFS